MQSTIYHAPGSSPTSTPSHGALPATYTAQPGHPFSPQRLPRWYVYAQHTRLLPYSSSQDIMHLLQRDLCQPQVMQNTYPTRSMQHGTCHDT